MTNVTFICGTPCGELQVAALEKAGYKVEDAVDHLLTTKYGEKCSK